MVCVSGVTVRSGKVAQWGNGAAVRIGAAALGIAHLSVDDAVDVIASADEIVIRRQRPAPPWPSCSRGSTRRPTGTTWRSTRNRRAARPRERLGAGEGLDLITPKTWPTYLIWGM
jgi:hypothetical protein